MDSEGRDLEIGSRLRQGLLPDLLIENGQAASKSLQGDDGQDAGFKIQDSECRLLRFLCIVYLVSWI